MHKVHQVHAGSTGVLLQCIYCSVFIRRNVSLRFAQNSEIVIDTSITH